MLKNEKIFITGGAGYLGKQIVKRYYDHNEITVFSRDEAKHYYLKKKYPKINSILGDVRNFELLNESMKGHTIGIFAASLKQIESVDQHPEEAVSTIIIGALNSRKAAIKNNLKAATFISTDKSRSPTTLYGAMKFVAGEAFIVNAERETTKLSSVIYGNVLNSTGSIIPLIWESMKEGFSLKLYSEDMTRFMIDVDSAVDCIDEALKHTGVSVVPHLKSFKVRDLFEIYEEKFGLKWTRGVLRISEKLHEQLISPQESARVKKVAGTDMYLIHYKDIYSELDFSQAGLSSEMNECLISKQELEEILKKEDYFKPKQ